MDNINSMMYAGEVPWHGKGTSVQGEQTAESALVKAGLNWRANKVPLRTVEGQSVPGHFAVVREDTKAVLGVVGNSYRILQNKEQFSLGDAIVGTKEAIYHTAGALGLGEKVWLLAKLPGHIRFAGDDITEKYLLFTNTHDGTASATVMFTPVRVVCQNTLNIAVASGERKQKMRHTKTLGLRVGEVREALGIMNQQYEVFGEAARHLVGKQLDGEGFQKLVVASGLIPAPDKLGKLSTRASNILEEVSAMFDRGRGNDLPGVRHTLWGGFNAVVEYVDYARSTKGEDKADARAQSLLFGTGAAIKQAAWDAAFELAK